MAQPADEQPALRSVSSIHQERERLLIDRYGGFSWGADFLGFAVAVFFTVVLFGIVGAIIGTVGYQMGAPVPKAGHIGGTTVNLGLAGLAGGLIAIFLAYLIGGYAAGRMARFNGALNGLGVVIWTIIIALLLGVLGAALGSSFNVGSQLNLHISATNVTIAGIISLAVALVVMSLAAILGGMLGAGYHRAIDRDAGIS